MNAIPWIQGMRPPEQLEDPHAISWQRLLFCRLTGRFSSIPSSTRTVASEAKLGVARAVYYYVGRTYPEFGHLVVASEPSSHPSAEAAAVAALDTGGLVSGWIPLQEELAPAQLAALVHERDLNGDTYIEVFGSWLDDAFTQTSSYVNGGKPAWHTWPEVDLEESVDERAWTWETRISAVDHAIAPVRPKAIFFQTGRRQLYFDWLRAERVLSTPQFEAHLNLIISTSREVDAPAEHMITYLEQEVS